MIIERVVANANEVSVDHLHKEKVYLASGDLLKRVQRVKTDHGRELGIRLTTERELHRGDILYMDDKNAIVVDVLSNDVLVIRPESLEVMGVIAHQIGNRHTPAQFDGDEMIVEYDYLIEEMLTRQQVAFSREERTLNEAFRPIGHSHD
ncbi:urease accessory protein UreE [Bacillus sp. CECT 9360]|uniref:urease accessory protein UreE n=1 Tax=Bacillus sp. CECT 9360 TaxID=2845821 RepID=UPI001E31DB12|nr:urease accessory protein UreE [Bacillus sp. CECT 9360]CAH0346522.1 Urease accessory protein UreE [Bacillus sp. CECT 9360]